MASDLINMMGVDPALSRNATAEAALVRAHAGLSAKKMEEIEATAKDFESVFVTEMLGQMFQSVDTGSDPMFGGGDAEDTWKSMMIDEYGKQVVRSGGIGLADSVKTKMIEMQEAYQK